MKKRKSTLTPKLRQNWWVDASLGIGALIAVLSSLYFLAYPNGGFQGGRNPYYDLVVIFSRQTWDIIHTWSGVMMIMAALIHILIHWDWILGPVARVWNVITGKRKDFGFRLTYNIILDATIALCFVLCSISGVYFLYNVSNGPAGQVFLFSKTTWDMIHTWSGVILTITATLHVVLHWKWVTNITSKMFGANRKNNPTGQATLESAEELA